MLLKKISFNVNSRLAPTVFDLFGSACLIEQTGA